MVSAQDLEVVSEQLGRQVRGVLDIAARCVCGRPLVVKTAPQLPDGTPFPTLYYLTHPLAVAAASRLEAAGVMKTMNEDLQSDEDLKAAYRKAHESYLADRLAVAKVPQIEGISAGGMPDRVKCLHVLFAHSLAKGPGVNPLGDRALELVTEQWSPSVCKCR